MRLLIVLAFAQNKFHSTKEGWIYKARWELDLASELLSKGLNRPIFEGCFAVGSLYLWMFLSFDHSITLSHSAIWVFTYAVRQSDHRNWQFLRILS